MIKHQPEALYQLDEHEVAAVGLIADYFSGMVSKKEAVAIFKQDLKLIDMYKKDIE